MLSSLLCMPLAKDASMPKPQNRINRRNIRQWLASLIKSIREGLKPPDIPPTLEDERDARSLTTRDSRQTGIRH